MKNFMKPRTWTDSLDKRPEREKMDMTFGLWNVRSLYRGVEVGWGDVDWIDLAQDRDRWRALVNSVLNLRVP
jgi:hypothetical protein